MPELPEVQTIVDDLNRKVAGRKITGVWFDWPKMLKDPLDQRRDRISHNYVKVFQKLIIGKKILRVKRRAKNILVYLTPTPKGRGSDRSVGGATHVMLIHLKMTGHLLVGKWKIGKKDGKEQAIPLEPKEVVEDSYNQYVHVIFYLDNKKMLGFSDVRKFGKVVLGKTAQIENLPELTNLGPEPLDPSFTLDRLKSALRQAQGKKIKQVLLDPNTIAGIGNIYSDDILWQSRIHPLRRTDSLSEKELKELYKAIRSILAKAVSLRGTSFSDFRDTSGKEGYYAGHRLVYQREDEPCSRCGTKIQRTVISGRSAHYCPTCQKLK